MIRNCVVVLLGLLCVGPAVLVAAETARRPMGMLTPRLSPTGERIVVSYQGAIATVPRTGGRLTVLTREEGWDSDPAWSPDGTRIAYVNGAPGGGPRGGGGLRVIDARTGGAVMLPSIVNASGPLWFNPDGRKLLARFGPAASARLGWLDLSTGTVTPLTFGAPDERIARQQWTPYALSEDGRFIFFAVHRDLPGQQTGDNGPQADLFRAAAAGGEAEQVCTFPARIYGLAADGQGRGIYAVTDVGASHNDIWHIPLAAPERGARKLTFSQADDDGPTTDAGGRWLVHTENSAGPTRLLCRETETGITTPVPIEQVDFGEPGGSLNLTLLDRTDREPAARISLQRQGGKFHAPIDAMYRSSAGLVHFYARAGAQLDLPAGRYHVRALRGPEYRVYHGSVEIKSGAGVEIAISLERWTDTAARGWFSGENHIHANYGYGAWYVTPRTLFDQCEAEDLRVSNLVVANSDGEAVFDREFFSGRPHALSTPVRIIYWNQEFRSTLWGHMTLFNLTRLVEPIFTGFRDTTNPFDAPTNAEIAGRTRTQNGVVSYTHPTNNAHDVFQHAYSAKGLPIDVALGRIDTIDVMGGVYETSVPVWYHVLNCGFRLPAAAGTDCFLNRVRSAPPGFGRVYVHLPGGLDYAHWIAGLRAGRSFVSNGPVLEFSAGDKAIGDTLALDAPSAVRVRARVEAQHPLRSVDLVFNGRTIASAALAPDKLSAAFDQAVPIEGSGWLALRVSGPPAMYWQGGDRAAHSNPIYVEVRGRPLERAASARYFLAWIDRLEQLLLARDRMDSERVHVLAHLEQAREIYREMLK